MQLFVSLLEAHVLGTLKKGLSVNDLGNYFQGSIREVVSASADKGVAADADKKGLNL